MRIVTHADAWRSMAAPQYAHNPTAIADAILRQLQSTAEEPTPRERPPADAV